MSRSASRSRSRSRSTSRSSSRSRSRSRKHRYSSRSRSRSRSRSPSYNRDKKYPRSYQNNRENNRENRGYHRGFRRPYNYRGRGRGRGYFQRGRYQRGGGGYNQNNHQNNRHNWKNYKQKQKQSRGQHHNVQRSPPPGQSYRSDRSSTPQSRHSSRGSPKCTPASISANQTTRELLEEQCTPKEVQNPEEREGNVVEMNEDKEIDGIQRNKSQGNWIPLTEVVSPKTSPVPPSVGTNTPQSEPGAKTTNGLSNGALSWMKGGSATVTKRTSQDGSNPVLTSFDSISTEEYFDGDKTALSIAFRKFLEEQNQKSKATSQNGSNRAPSDVEEPKVNRRVSRKHTEEGGSEVSLNSLLKASPFLSEDSEDEEETTKSHSHKDRLNGNEPKTTVTSRVFQEHFGKWQKAACVLNGDTTAAESVCVNKNQEKASAKRECGQKWGDASPDRGCKVRKMTNSSPGSVSSPRARDMMTPREDFCVEPKNQAMFKVKIDFLGDSLLSSSDILAKERQLSQDLVQSSKKDKEFRSIFHHVQTAPRSPSELFAQHVVTILHHVRAQHFTSSGLTLNERFTLYQSQAAEKEQNPRKSPEIHRRLEVSPSAFKKHSQIFEAIKREEEGTYKDAGERVKGDLRVDIEQRKHYITFTNLTDHAPERREYTHPSESRAGEGPESTEQPTVTFSKAPRRSLKPRSRSSSSSSSSSSSKSEEEEESRLKSEVKKDELNKNGQTVNETQRSCDRPQGGFQIQIRGRRWSRGSFQGNSSRCNSVTDDWDPEYTPRSKKYYLHDDRDGEAGSRWTDRGRGSFSRGRGRFLVRNPGPAPNNRGQRWAPSDQEQAGTGQERTGGQT